MTVSEVIDAIRRKYNAVSDTHWSDAEIRDLIYQAELDMARETFIIEGTDTSTTTVSGTISYTRPTDILAIKRLTWNGQPLKQIDFEDDSLLTGGNDSTTATGTPKYFFEFGTLVYLRPIPNAAQTLKYYAFKEPVRVTAASTLDIPTQFHMSLVDFCTAHMFFKEKYNGEGTYHMTLWKAHVEAAKRYVAKRKQSQRLQVVKDEETYEGYEIMGL